MRSASPQCKLSVPKADPPQISIGGKNEHEDNEGKANAKRVSASDGCHEPKTVGKPLSRLWGKIVFLLEINSRPLEEPLLFSDPFRLFFLLAVVGCRCFLSPPNGAGYRAAESRHPAACARAQFTQ